MILKYDIFLLTQARYSIGEITIPNAHVFQNNQADYDFSSGRNKTSMFIQLKIIFIEYGKRCISYRLVLFYKLCCHFQYVQFLVCKQNRPTAKKISQIGNPFS